MGTISKATVIGIKEFGPEIREYRLLLDKNNHFEAGSFLLLTLEKRDSYTSWPEFRNFSIASAFRANDSSIRLIIRKVGVYTTRIFNELNIGDACMVKYAYGDFLLPFFDKEALICCIAGGTGIAPILSFCEQLEKEKQLHRLHVFYSFKNEVEMMGVEALRAKVPAAQLHLFCTRQAIDSIPNRRIEWNDIQQAGFDWLKTYFYICGGETFTSAFVNNFKLVEAENVFTDEW